MIWRPAGAQQHSGDRNLLLEVVINGRAVGMVADFHEHRGKLYATRAELESVGLRVRGRASAATVKQEVSLDALAGVTYRMEERTQTVYVTARNTALRPAMLSAGSPDATETLPVESGFGAVANYDVVATTSAGQTQTEGLLDARAFSPWGVVATSMIGANLGSYNARAVLRLDSTYTYSDPDTLRRYRVGDIISGGLAWTRPVRLGGAQITSDFSLRPDLVTFPVPTISGQVAVPSSVDVLVNGVQLLARDVPPGPFEINQLPVVTGAGDVSVVVRDALGQETRQTLPFYASALLLTPGLSAFSGEAGALRLNYGSVSNDYRSSAGTMSYRYGWSDWLTLEGHGEASGGGSAYGRARASQGGMAGGGAAFAVGHLGVVSLSAAGSSFGGHSGTFGSVSVEHSTLAWSVAGSVQVADSGYRDIAANYGEPVPNLQTRASVGLALGRFGSVGVGYVGRRQQASGQPQQALADAPYNLNYGSGIDGVSLVPASRTSLLSVSYTRPMLDNRAYLYTTSYNDFANRGSFGVMAGIAFTLGSRDSFSASGGGGSGQSYATLQASRSVNVVGDVGGQVMESLGQPSRQMAEGQYKSPWALVTGGFDRISGLTAYRGSVQGSLAYADGGLFATNTIYDSFAVVDTEGAAGVHVLQENRPVGVTGSSGKLLVPDLRSFGVNRLAIDPTDVPEDAEVGETTRTIRPQDRSGVVARFPVRLSHGAMVRLVDQSGAAIEVGSSARLKSSTHERDAEVGYDGEAFVIGLHAHDTVVVTRPGGRRCTATFAYKAVAGTLPSIGPVICRDLAP